MREQEKEKTEVYVRLRMLRKEKGYTQAKLAEKLQYGCSTISSYESGRNEPNISDLIRIAKIFDVTVDYLIGIDNRRKSFEFAKISLHLDTFIRLYCNAQAEEKQYLNFIILGVVKLCKKQRRNDT